ncbi:hypothetical protein D9757_013767 [Collybiopsis confluens]|uniref:Uncharacterized protein n=1 Tax=Collybiopsis confluens TaxID=2823264 RepID=A0A8H5FV58_9AGAR|nr:hypothetical protein D9757_013767 [Collybiopsis confluens]
MAIVEYGIKVWLVRATKDEAILPSKEIKRFEGKTARVVEAEVECSISGMPYYMYWQQTQEYPAQKAACTVFTLLPNLAKTQRGDPVTMMPGQQQVVYSTRHEAEDQTKFFELSPSVFSQERLKENNGIVGYAELRVDFLEQTENEAVEGKSSSIPVKLPSILFKFIFKDGELIPTKKSNVQHHVGTATDTDIVRDQRRRQPSSRVSQRTLKRSQGEQGHHAPATDSPQPVDTVGLDFSQTAQSSTEILMDSDDALSASIEEAQRGLKESHVVLKRARLNQYRAIQAMRARNEEEIERLNQETSRIRGQFEKTF